MQNPLSNSPLTPRGEHRILYVSDPSSIVANFLPDPVTADSLRQWVDMLADSGVDIFQQDCFNQGFTAYWRSEQMPYDQRPQHAKFLTMLDAGEQPLQVLLDRSHERGMTFIAGFRMNDNHAGEHYPRRAAFMDAHPEWLLLDPTLEKDDQRMLDFSFEGVRQFIFEAMERVVDSFDVDGIEMTFREPMYFPPSQGADRAHCLTELVQRLRDMLDEVGRARGKKLLMGARVYAKLEENLSLGLDVPTWISKDLIDYVSPMDPMYCNFNAGYADFSELTRKSDCMLYPGTAPWTSFEARRRNQIPAERLVTGRTNMTRSNYRALAQTFYGGGADGLSVYNHFVGGLYPPPYYPQALQVFYELRDLPRAARGDRHYIFEPPGDSDSITSDLTERVVLDRESAQPSGIFRFQAFEQNDQIQVATLMLRGSLTLHDVVDVQLNGATIAPGPFGKPDIKYQRPFPDIRWFPLPADALAYGENQLSITLTKADPDASGEIVIDEVELWVQPV
ncbi:MAG: family 10 glycosylhydrolase [Lentisphaeria bacterium]